MDIKSKARSELCLMATTWILGFRFIFYSRGVEPFLAEDHNSYLGLLRGPHV